MASTLMMYASPDNFLPVMCCQNCSCTSVPFHVPLMVPCYHMLGSLRYECAAIRTLAQMYLISSPLTLRNLFRNLFPAPPRYWAIALAKTSGFSFPHNALCPQMHTTTTQTA
eukprot:14389-Amphidinium_carterae.4